MAHVPRGARHSTMLKFYPFDQINQAIADSESGRAIKPVLTFADAP